MEFVTDTNYGVRLKRKLGVEKVEPTPGERLLARIAEKGNIKPVPAAPRPPEPKRRDLIDLRNRPYGVDEEFIDQGLRSLADLESQGLIPKIDLPER
jgi:hypothetical protein